MSQCWVDSVGMMRVVVDTVKRSVGYSTRVHVCLPMRAPDLHVPPSTALVLTHMASLPLSYAGCTFANNSLSSGSVAFCGGLYLQYSSSSVASSPVSLDGE